MEADNLTHYGIFGSKAMTNEEAEVVISLRSQFHDLHEYLVSEVKPSRERSLAITAMEEASMWANKAVLTEGLVSHGE